MGTTQPSKWQQRKERFFTGLALVFFVGVTLLFLAKLHGPCDPGEVRVSTAFGGTTCIVSRKN